MLSSTISLPELKPLDHGDLTVFEGETDFLSIGISLYKRPQGQASFAIVGRKTGPQDGYLWQYQLKDDGQGFVKMTLVRKFEKFSGE